MTGDNSASRTLDIYLRQVRHGLRGLPDDEAQEIVNELRSHALDRAGGTLTVNSVDATIAGLGSARELAGAYLAERMAERVEATRSPWLILTTVWRLAGLSVRAFFACLISFVGYATGASFIVTALLKPVFPDKVGCWVGTASHPTFSIGIVNNPDAHEIMGWWLIPFCLAIGALVLWLTWRFGLRAVRKIGQSRAAILRKGDR
ncbi:MAG TPA: hypothetical protein VG407_11390 [Caulobacteraceae bacterium]|jgi:hypothetical protein|nr:hypothetical protein [Caulobacteraceae bacterium]